MQEYEKCQNPWSPYGEGNSGIFSFYECEVTEREVSSGGVNGIWEDELPRGGKGVRGSMKLRRMNCHVDRKGVRKSMESRKMDDLEKNKSDKSQRGA